MGAYQAQIEPDALEFLADIAGGDARAALNAVELGVMTTQRSEDGKMYSKTCSKIRQNRR